MPSKELKVSTNLNPEVVMNALKEVKVPGTRVDVVSVNLIGDRLRAIIDFRQGQL